MGSEGVVPLEGAAVQDPDHVTFDATDTPVLEFQIAHPVGSSREPGWLLTVWNGGAPLEHFFGGTRDDDELRLVRSALQKALEWRLSKVWD